METLSDLKPYTTRIFLANDQKHFEELARLLKKTYKLLELQIDTVTMMSGERKSNFQLLLLPNLPPIYLILLENPKVGPRRIKNVFDLVAYGKGSPAIIYVHDSAISNFKLAVLHNFPIILFHNDNDFKSYFASQRLGFDDKELLFVLAQKQDYVMKQIVFREDFAQMKEEKSSHREKHSLKSPKAKPEVKQVAKPEKRIELRREPLESPPQLKDAVTKPSPPSKKLTGFAEVARKNLKTSPPSPENQKATVSKSTTTKPIRVSNETIIKRQWTLPVDVEPTNSIAQTPSLFES